MFVEKLSEKNCSMRDNDAEYGDVAVFGDQRQEGPVRCRCKDADAAICGSTRRFC